MINNLKEEIKKNNSSFSILIKLSEEVRRDPNFKKDEIKRIAILSDFTLKGLGDCLMSKAFYNDIYIDIYEGDYGQWQQEILGEELYKFNPDLNFIILDNFGLDRDLFYNYHCLENGKIKKIMNDYLNNLLSMIGKIKNKNKGKIVVSNISSYGNLITGITSNKVKNNLRKLILEANIVLENEFLNDKQVFIFDYDGWLGHIGKDKYLYGKYYFLGDMRIEPASFPLLSDQLLAYLIPIASKTKKCLVLDLDNTIWGGIIGEDNMEGIKLSPTGEGKMFYIFQKLILSLSKLGIILAINSKNNKEDVDKVFKEHPYMILKEDDFAAIRINWQDKVTNMKELAEELNIGLDSMVFMDDDPANREMIRKMIPEVEVIDLPEDPAFYWKTLLEYKGFSTLKYTDEDRDRGKMYFAEKKRRDLKKELVDMDSFLKNLNLEVEIKPITKFDIPRVTQLTQKTNQFNLTTRRYQEENIKKFIENNDQVWTLNVNDKFGDYGLVGVIIARSNKKVWEIDTFLLSCRVLGKKIEENFFRYMLKELRVIESKKVIGKYIPTKKNMQVEYFYKKIGFTVQATSEIETIWQLDLAEFDFVPANHITFNKKYAKE